MLTQLLPDQISKFWDVIKYAIEQSLPPTVGESPDKMNRILASLLSSKAQCWASYTKSENMNKFEGVVVTKILYDDVSNTKNLLMYCLYGYTQVDKSSWIHGIKVLTKYAESRGCARIIAYTDVPYMINMAKTLGGEANYTLCSFSVEQIIQKLNELGL